MRSTRAVTGLPVSRGSGPGMSVAPRQNPVAPHRTAFIHTLVVLLVIYEEPVDSSYV